MLNSASLTFILLINVEMTTIVGILTFISRINTKLESLRARKILIFLNFSFYEQQKIHARLSTKKVYNLGPEVQAERKNKKESQLYQYLNINDKCTKTRYFDRFMKYYHNKEVQCHFFTTHLVITWIWI